MQRIAIDMDDVIADAMSRFYEWYERDFQETFTEEQRFRKNIKDVIPAERWNHIVQYAHTDGFFQDLPVMPDSQRVIKELSKKYEIFIASAAMEFKTSLVHKLEWLNKNFPFINWTHIVFCGNKSIVNADYLIDDNVHHFKHFRGQGILFTAPHNLIETWNSRVNNWKEVGDMLL